MRITGTTMTLANAGSVALRAPSRTDIDVRVQVADTTETATVFLTALEAESLGKQLIDYAKELRAIAPRRV